MSLIKVYLGHTETRTEFIAADTVPHEPAELTSSKIDCPTTGTKFYKNYCWRDVPVDHMHYYSPLPSAHIKLAVLILNRLNEKKTAPNALFPVPGSSSPIDPENVWYDLDLTKKECPVIIRHEVALDLVTNRAAYKTRHMDLAFEKPEFTAPDRPAAEALAPPANNSHSLG